MAVGAITGRFDPSRGRDARVTMTFGSAPSCLLLPNSSSKGCKGAAVGERGNENDSPR